MNHACNVTLLSQPLRVISVFPRAPRYAFGRIRHALLLRAPLPQPIRLERQIAVVEPSGEPPHERAE